MTDGPSTYAITAYVEAWRLSADNLTGVAAWCGGREGVMEPVVEVLDMNGDIATAEIGDWVVHGTEGWHVAPAHVFDFYYKPAVRPIPVTRGVLTGEQLRVTDRREAR